MTQERKESEWEWPAGGTICSRRHQDLGLENVSYLATSVSDSWLSSRIQGSLPSGHSPTIDWQPPNPNPEHKKSIQVRHPGVNLFPQKSVHRAGAPRAGMYELMYVSRYLKKCSWDHCRTVTPFTCLGLLRNTSVLVVCCITCGEKNWSGYFFL